jgi:hypothetical protein
MKRSSKRASLVGLTVIVLLSPVLFGFTWEDGASSSAPRLFVYPHTVYVGKDLSGRAFHHEITVWNTGIGVLKATVSTDAPCIRVLSHSSFSLEQNKQITLGFLGCFPSAPGEFSGSITIRSNGGSKTVRLRGVVQRPTPELSIDPESIYLGEKPAGKAFHGELTVKNNGIRTLTGTFSKNSPWIRTLSSFSFRLAPGEDLRLGFLGHFPSAPGEFSGSISVYYDGTSKTVKLRGVVREMGLSVEPESIYLGEGAPGKAFYGQFFANNNGTQTLSGTVTKNVPWIRSLSFSSFQLPQSQQVLIGFLGHFPLRYGGFTGTITVYSNGGYRTVKVYGVVQKTDSCTVEMPDWLQSGLCPPWIRFSQWQHLSRENREAILEWALRTWDTWIQQLTIEGRLCEADIEEYLILVQGLHPLFIVEKCWWRRPQYAQSTFYSDVLGYPAYLDWVMWTGVHTENLGYTWYEVIYDGRIGWMRSSNFGDPFPFDMTQAMVAIPQDPAIAEAARAGPAQFIDIREVVPGAPARNTMLCGEFCVAALLGEEVDFRVLNLLRAWTHEHSRAVYLLEHNIGTWRKPDLYDMLNLYDVAYENLDRHLSCQELEDELHSGKMLIAFVNIDTKGSNSCGGMDQRGGEADHWVVVEDAKAVGDGGWIRMYNPYWNREEIYTYEEFENAWVNYGLWVMRGVRSDGQGREQKNAGRPQMEPTPTQAVVQSADSSLRTTLDRDGSRFAKAPEEKGYSDQRPLRPAEDIVTGSTTHGLAASGDQGHLVDTDEGFFSASEKETSYAAVAAFQSSDVLGPYNGEGEGEIPDRSDLTAPQKLGSGVSEEVVIHFFNTTPTTIERVVKVGTASRDDEIVQGKSDGAGDVAFNAAHDPYRNEPQYRRFDLGREVSMKGIRFEVDRSSDEPIGYQVWVAGNSGSWKLVYEFSARPLDGEVFEKHFSPPVEEVRYVEIRTPSRPAWISGVEVF